LFRNRCEATDFGRIFYSLYDFLNIGQKPEKVDCIFVYAGRPERKAYGLELVRQGYANRIIFSVGRFEWRGFPRLGLEQDGGLRELVQKTPPKKRHFFVYSDGQQTHCYLIKLGKLGTFSEALALSQFIRRQNIRSLIIVSTAFHLRRACETLRRHCSDLTPRIIPVAVPESLASDARKDWWANRASFLLIVKEYVKYGFYKMFSPCFHKTSVNFAAE
jgi:uncharacterized SAM-binding protein YcdF (DUF218 family)